MAYTPATTNPAVTSIATTKCQYCGPNMGVKIALRTSTSTGLPSESREKPWGVFIQELAARMPKAPSSAVTGSGSPSRKWVRAGRRRHP